MAGRTKMAMSSDFLDAFARLPRSQQRGVRTLISRFNADFIKVVPAVSSENVRRSQGRRGEPLLTSSVGHPANLLSGRTNPSGHNQL